MFYIDGAIPFLLLFNPLVNLHSCGNLLTSPMDHVSRKTCDIGNPRTQFAAFREAYISRSPFFVLIRSVEPKERQLAAPRTETESI